jgi:hypothetical protein
MTKEQLIRWALEKMERYCRETTPKERFQQLIDDGIIDKDGKVLLYCGEDGDGPEASNGQDSKEQKEPDPQP